jgi:hypothetical protein
MGEEENVLLREEEEAAEGVHIEVEVERTHSNYLMGKLKFLYSDCD